MEIHTGDAYRIKPFLPRPPALMLPIRISLICVQANGPTHVTSHFLPGFYGSRTNKVDCILRQMMKQRIIQNRHQFSGVCLVTAEISLSRLQFNISYNLAEVCKEMLMTIILSGGSVTRSISLQQSLDWSPQFRRHSGVSLGNAGIVPIPDPTP